MQAAVRECGKGYPQRVAAARFNVLKSTLADRMSGRVVDGSTSGPATLLTKDDENALSAYLLKMANEEYGKSKEIILYMATAMAKKGGKRCRISKGQREKVTVLECASGTGTTLSPMFIFKSQSGRIPYGVKDEAPAGTLFAAQKSGWIDKDIYLKWFNDLFLPSLPPERPVMLLLDGHRLQT